MVNKSKTITLLPYLQQVKNRKKILTSIFLGKTPKIIEFKNGKKINVESLDFNLLVCLLGAITFSTSYTIINGKIEFSFDTKNKFSVNIENPEPEDKILLELFFYAQKYGANFIKDDQTKDFRDDTLRIYSDCGKKIIETNAGIKFYVDSIHPRILTETFVQKIHLINSQDDWKNKTVLDIGASFGDTPLFYSQLGAEVYAIEANKTIYENMLKNFSLNPSLSKKITPVNMAVGKLRYQLYKNNYNQSDLEEYTFEQTFEKLGLSHVDLLKLDCKGCEHELTEKFLKNVNRIKIEYREYGAKNQKLEDLLKLLDNSGFKTMIYRHSPLDNNSNKNFGLLYGFSDH